MTTSMQIKINGESETIEETLTIAELVAGKGLVPERIVVEHNLEIVPKDKWRDVILSNEDSLEIISFVGGG